MNPMTLLSLLLVTVGFAFPRGGADLTPEEFQKLHSTLLKAEKWENIPWQGNLLEARALAYKEKKPLFLWCMDAKPLGSV